jgi:hypothetical protein
VLDDIIKYYQGKGEQTNLNPSIPEDMISAVALILVSYKFPNHKHVFAIRDLIIKDIVEYKIDEDALIVLLKLLQTAVTSPVMAQSITSDNTKEVKQ